MTTTVTDPETYELDFYRWTQRQAAELRRAATAGSNLPLDWANLAEEIESLGASDRRELASRLEQIVAHILKLQLSPSPEPRRGWQETVDRERSEVADLLSASPSLRNEVEPAIARRWPAVRRRVTRALAGEIAEAAVPRSMPYTVNEVLDPDWWPGPPPS